MGCICSKGVSEIDDCEREKELSKSSVQLATPVLSKREEVIVEVIGGGGVDGSLCLVSKASSRASSGPVNAAKDNEEKKNRIVERSTESHHQRRATMDLGSSGGHPEMTKIIHEKGTRCGCMACLVKFSCRRSHQRMGASMGRVV